MVYMEMMPQVSDVEEKVPWDLIGQFFVWSFSLMIVIWEHMWPYLAQVLVQGLGMCGFAVTYDTVVNTLPKVFGLIVCVLACLAVFRIGKAAVVCALTVAIFCLIMSALQRYGLIDFSQADTIIQNFGVAGQVPAATGMLGMGA